MGLSIRSAAPADAGALADFAARTFAETFGHGSSAEDMTLHLASTYSPERQGAEIADPGTDVLIADHDGTLAGYVQLRQSPAPNCITAVTPIELWRFYVDGPFHGQGIAAVLMDAAIDAARKRGGDVVWLSVWEHNARAHAFYAKHGFSRAGTTTFVVGTDVQTDWVMRRGLVVTNAAP